MHTIKKNTHAYGVVAENINSVDIGHSESKKWKESPNLSTLNDASMPNSFSVCSASGMPQVSSLDLLAVTYGDSVDSDEDDDASQAAKKYFFFVDCLIVQELVKMVTSYLALQMPLELMFVPNVCQVIFLPPH